MAPNVASEITLLLKKGPPFEPLKQYDVPSIKDGPAGNLLNL